MEDDGITPRLQLALREALRARDPIAVSALRSALAAIDNASAVSPAPAPSPGTGSAHIAGAVDGLGAGETERRHLTEAHVEQIVTAEIAERNAVARDYDRAGHPNRAHHLRHEAGVLLSTLESNSAR